MILFVSCEAPSQVELVKQILTHLNKMFKLLKILGFKGFEEENFDKAVSFMADSIQWTGPNGSDVGIDL